MTKLLLDVFKHPAV